MDANGNLLGDGDRFLVPSEAAGFCIDVAALRRCMETTVHRGVNDELLLQILQETCVAGVHTWGLFEAAARLSAPVLLRARGGVLYVLAFSLSALFNRVEARYPS